MPQARLGSVPTIKVAGAALPPEKMNELVETRVDQSVHLPDMFTLRFHDTEMKVVDDATFEPGKEVEISVRATDTLESQRGEQGVLIKGEVVAVEVEFRQEGFHHVVVRGYDKSHRLHREKKVRTFLNKKDSDVASQIAGDVGLSADVEATTTVHEHLFQANQTDWEFLRGRAREIGYELFATDGKLVFKKAPIVLGAQVDLEYNTDVVEFRSRGTAAPPADAVEVRGWDVKAKKAITGQHSTSRADVGNEGGRDWRGGGMGAEKVLVTDLPLAEPGQADAIARAEAARHASASLEAEGVARGNPELRAGIPINLRGVGTRFSGKYLITSVTHVFDQLDGYNTRFRATGLQDRSAVLSLVALGDTNGAQPAGVRPIYGVVPGIVTDNADPEKLWRVKLKFPWLDDAQETDWVRVAQQGAGKERGLLILPEIDDEVLVAFEHGDVRRPYVVGGLFSRTDTTPGTDFAQQAAVENGKVERRGQVTRIGHKLVFDDKSGEESILIQTQSGDHVLIDQANKKIEILMQGEKLVLDSQSRQIQVVTTGNLKAEAQQGTELKSQTQFSIDAQGQIKIKSSAGIELEAPMIKVNAQGNLDLKAAGMANLDASGITTVKGSLVKIN